MGSCVQIIRVCADRGKRALFRGWSRLCLHAASLSAAEGVAAAAAATSRAVRAEAMGREAAEAIAAADIASRERKRAELARKDVMNKWGNLAKRLVGKDGYSCLHILYCEFQTRSRCNFSC